MSKHNRSSNSELIPGKPAGNARLVVSGRDLADKQGRTHLITGISILYFTLCAEEPIEVVLGEEDGSWWIPEAPVVPASEVTHCIDAPKSPAPGRRSSR